MESPILSILRAAATDNHRLSLDNFTEAQALWAIETGLGPLLYHVTKGNPGTASSPFKLHLLSADLTARMLSQEIAGAMSEIIDTCISHNTRLTLLKGISICEQHYPEPHLRLMRDIDFLVDVAAYPSVESALLACGYRKDPNLPSAFYENHHHGIPLFHPNKRIWVEIHTGLFPPKLGLGRDRVFGKETIDSQRERSEFQEHEVYRLSNELQIVYIAAHGAMEFRRVGGAIPMLDLIYLLKGTRGEIDWDRLLYWLQDSRAATSLFVLLTWLDRFDLVSVDRPVLNKLSSIQPTFGKPNLAIAHSLIDEYIVKGRQYGRLLTDHNLGIVWETLFSPGPASRNLLFLPWNVMFPPRNPLRFNPNFQFKRIKSALGLKR